MQAIEDWAPDGLGGTIMKQMGVGQGAQRACGA